MKSNVLINRICRLIETGGASGDGALLAEEYATAVIKVNNRLEAVVTAADSRSIGDAIRILSEDPPLLEDVSALDFFQRSEWENLCDMKGWTIPPRIDRQMTDRAVAIGETKDAIEPLLAMYKKAVRVNNVRLAVKSLRRLADIDHSQDWRRNLRQFERQLQLHIVEEFRTANKDGKEDVCDALASELLDTAWLDGAIASGTEEVREYRSRRDAERRDMEGVEDLAILKKCLDEKWNRKLAFHLVQAVDGLVEKGWRISDDDKRVVDGCRVKCAHEFEQEETDRRWREVNEALNAAIQQEDGDAIREALAVPEFSNKEPDDGMAARATNLLSRMEKARRRSRLLKMVVTFLFAAVTVSITGWLIDQHILQKRIDNSAKALTGLLEQFKERPGFTIREMRSTLDWLEKNEPRIYGTPEISGFHANLSRIESANCARTNDIENLLKELEKWVSQSRSEGISGATIANRITAIESKILSDKDEDPEFKDRLVKASESWKSHAAERASKFRGNVVPRLKLAAGRLVGELARGNLRKEVGDCKALLEEWNTVHSRYADGQSYEFTVAKNDFDNALAEQNAYSNAIARLITAADASAVLVARSELVERYGGYREVKPLKPLSVAIDEVTDVLSPRPAELKPFLDSIRTGISDSEFKNFLEESVRPIEKWPEYCSLYGIYEKNGQDVFAIAKGTCKISKPGYETRWIVSCDGGLLSMDDRRIVQSLKRKAKPEARLLPSSDEMRLLVEKSKAETIDAASF